MTWSLNTVEVFLHEMQMIRKARQALEVEVLTSLPTTQTAAPARSSGQPNNGTAPDESAVNSAGMLVQGQFHCHPATGTGKRSCCKTARSRHYAVTVRLPDPDNQLMVRSPVTVSLKAVPAPIAAPAMRSDEDQSDTDDTILGSHTPGESGTPHVEPLEIKQPDPAADVRIIEHIGCHCRGDPMEDLDCPDKPPPSDVSQFSGRCVEMWDRNGNSMGLVWVTHCMAPHVGNSCKLLKDRVHTGSVCTARITNWFKNFQLSAAEGQSRNQVTLFSGTQEIPKMWTLTRWMHRHHTGCPPALAT